jgi:hypothetical protein
LPADRGRPPRDRGGSCPAPTPVVANRSRYSLGDIPSFFWTTRRMCASSPKQARAATVFDGSAKLVTGRVWKGSAFGGARGHTDVPKIVDWYMENKINIDDLITHHLPLDRINDGFDLMKKGESIRSVVVF